MLVIILHVPCSRSFWIIFHAFLKSNSKSGGYSAIPHETSTAEKSSMKEYKFKLPLSIVMNRDEEGRKAFALRLRKTKLYCQCSLKIFRSCFSIVSGPFGLHILWLSVLLRRILIRITIHIHLLYFESLVGSRYILQWILSCILFSITFFTPKNNDSIPRIQVQLV